MTYDREAEVCNLESSSKYDCELTVKNSIGDGPTTNRTYYTDVICKYGNNNIANKGKTYIDVGIKLPFIIYNLV